jgi:hypothetical protein
MARFGSALTVVFSLLVTSSLLAAYKSPAEKPQPSTEPVIVMSDHEAMCKSSAERKIDEALKSPTHFVFVDLPLDQVVEYLKEKHKIEIQIDKKALEDVNIGTNTPVTRNLKGISLRSALRLMLKELGLTYVIKDEVLLITTPDEADNQLITKVLDVADLVMCRDKDGKLWDDYRPLIYAITSTVEPTTWEQVGGAGSIIGASVGTAKVLVVSQRQDVHEQIAPLLAKFRRVAQETPSGELPRRDKKLPKHTGAGERQNDAGNNDNRFEFAQVKRSPWRYELFRIDKDTGTVWQLTDNKSWQQIQETSPFPPPEPDMDGMGGGMGMFSVPTSGATDFAPSRPRK